MINREYPYYQIKEISSIKDLIIASVRKDTPAIIDCKNGHEFSYSSFSDDIIALSNWLLSIVKNNRIAIIGKNSYLWLVAFFAAVCGGHMAVLLDKELSTQEIYTALKNSDTRILLCDSSFCESLGELESIEIHSFDRLAEIIQNNPTNDMLRNSFIERRIDLDIPCCMFFTSGTDGNRKAVMLSHRNLAADINGACRLFELTGDTYAILPFHHAFGLIVAVLMVLNYGRTVYIGSGLKRMRRELSIAMPQTMMLVPLFVESFHKQIWDMAKKTGKEKRLRRAMRISDVLLRLGIDLRKRLFREVLAHFGGNMEYIICGGAPLDAHYVKEFRSFGIEILNGYGTTECSPVAAVNRNHYHKDGTVGLPIPGSEVRIAEDGEVLIRGDHVMLGYYHNEDATKAVLHDGWYATGDLGTLDKDGFLTLYGRKKSLIILSNGENVSPEELEEKLYRIGGVDEVLVAEENGMIVAEIYTMFSIDDITTVHGSIDDKVIVETHKVIEKEVATLNRTLPTYKRIACVRFRDTPFEKTSTKKIKRRENSNV